MDENNTWYTLVWKDNARTIPSIRAVWLSNDMLISVRDDNGVFIATVDPGQVLLEDCLTWEEAQKAAVDVLRERLKGRMREIQKTIDLLDTIK